MSLRLAITLSLTLCLAAAAQADTVSKFRDDFTGALADGWTILNEDPPYHSIGAQGTYHVQTQRGGLGQGKTANNLLLRPVSGNFIIQTKLLMDPETAQQWGALVVYVDGVVGVVSGLVYAQGTSSTFRGVVALSSTGDPNTASRGGTYYDSSHTATPNVVWLRMLRNGQQFAMAYSADGVNFTELKTFENSLIPDTVYVGVGAANGDFEACGSACDSASIPADFDFFEIQDFDGSTNIDPNAAPPPTNGGTDNTPTVTSISISGPDSVVIGGTASYAVTANYSDGSTGDLSSGITWAAVPNDRAAISGGNLTVLSTSATNVTISAKVTSGGAVRSDYKVVSITAPSSAAPGLCAGLGGFSLVPFTALGIAGLRRRRAA